MMESKGLACWGILFHMLIFLGTCDSQSSSYHQMDDTEQASGKTLLFHFEDLKLGNQMRMYFPDEEPNKPLSFPYDLWPRERADVVPFSSAKIPEILAHFSIPQGSPKAQAIESTLKICEYKLIKIETKACVTSLESLGDFTRKVFGPDPQIYVASSRRLTISKAATYQNYTITQSPRLIADNGPKKIGCHTIRYPFPVFYCHHVVGGYRVYRAQLSGENGDNIEATALCHMDTSQWERDHGALTVLGIKPGDGPVCHFFGAENYVLFPSSSAIF